jgi:hypothetical protein
MAQQYYDPTDQYYDDIAEFHDDDDNYYQAEGTPLHNNLRQSESNNPFMGDDYGAGQDLEPLDRLDRGNYNNPISMSGRQSSQNWSGSNQSFSSFHQHQQPPPLLEGFDDDEDPWTNEGTTGGNATKLGKRSASKAKSKK